jgi:hypothetical protein
MPRYDDFSRSVTDPQQVVDKLNGAFCKTPGVAHNHKQKASGAMDEGNGGPIELEGIDQTYAGGSNEGTLWQVVSWMARQIKAFHGLTNWYDTISKSFKDIFESDGVTAKKATDSDKLDGKHRVLVVDSSQVMIAPSTESISLLPGGQHNFYEVSVYSPQTLVYDYNDGDTVYAEWNIYRSVSTEFNDVLILRNLSSATITMYYKVYAWQ